MTGGRWLVVTATPSGRYVLLTYAGRDAARAAVERLQSDGRHLVRLMHDPGRPGAVRAPLEGADDGDG